MPVDIKELIEDGELDTSLIEEMELAEKAPEPGEIIPDRKGSKPAFGDSVSSAGYVYIYDTRNGQRSMTNRNMLPAQLKKKRPDGSRVFTVRNPQIPQKQGTIKCRLHHDDQERGHFDEMGFPECPMAKIPSPYQLEMHMQKRHPAEWKAMLRGKQMEKEANERLFQEAVIKSVTKPETAEEKPPLYISDKKKK